MREVLRKVLARMYVPNKLLVVWAGVFLASLAMFVVSVFAYEVLVPQPVLDRAMTHLRNMSYQINSITSKPEKWPSNVPRNNTNIVVIPREQKLFMVANVIFANNAILNALFAIPVSGVVLYALTITVTGSTVRMLTHMVSPSCWYCAFSSFMLKPHVYTEFLAYSLNVALSLWITYRIAARNFRAIKNEALGYLFMFASSFIILYVSALIESTIIIS